MKQDSQIKKKKMEAEKNEKKKVMLHEEVHAYCISGM